MLPAPWRLSFGLISKIFTATTLDHRGGAASKIPTIPPTVSSGKYDLKIDQAVRFTLPLLGNQVNGPQAVGPQAVVVLGRRTRAGTSRRSALISISMSL